MLFRSVRKLDDIKIIDLYWERSESAIDETSLKYGNYCTKIAINILQNREDSEECVSDTYLKAWDAIPPQRPAKLSAFLGRITRNLSFNRFTARNTQKRGGTNIELLLSELEECIPSDSSVEADYEAGQTARIIDAFLASAKPDNRIIFVRRYWYADSITEIASRFDMSESKVKSILFRTRNKLKDYLEKEGVVL